MEDVKVESASEAFKGYELPDTSTQEQVDAVFDAYGSSDLTDLRKVCTGTIEAYIAEIAEMSVQLEDKSEL